MDDSFTRQVLPVPTSLDKDINGNAVPSDAMEYLYMVRSQANAMPNFFVTSKATTTKPNEDFINREWPNTMEVDEGYMTWRINFLRRFEKQREAIRDYLEFQNTILSPTFISLPAAKDECNWMALINGRRIQGTSDRGPSTAPDFEVLRSMTQQTSLIVLSFLSDWIQDQKTISDNQSRWIYTLLLHLNSQPLTGDEISILRTLARRCIQVRANCGDLSQHTSDQRLMQATANMVIAIVSEIFGQKDLL